MCLTCAELPHLALKKLKHNLALKHFIGCIAIFREVSISHESLTSLILRMSLKMGFNYFS